MNARPQSLVASASVSLLAALLLLPGCRPGPDVPTPEEAFGFEIGEHRKLADWSELSSYYQDLALGSPRVRIDTLGSTVLGNPFVMLTVTSAENQARLDELHEIQLKLSDPRQVSGPDELERLLDEGRTVVLLTHAIHSTEVGSAQVAARVAHRLASSDAERVRRILDEVILLHVPALNPDGTEMVVDWYREWVGTEYEAAPIPFLYHHYVGHDNNRDWYAFTQPETRHTIRHAHNGWHPQIVHDVHQMGGSGARIFFPPFVDPWEGNIDPAITAAVNQLGAYQAAELVEQGKSGVVVNAIYDAFTPARAYQHYHAGARILSETASARLASPDTIPSDSLRARRGFDPQDRSWNFPRPWPGGEWGLPDIVEYMDAGIMALLTHAANNRRFWLENFYGVNERAVEGWDEWSAAWVLPSGQENEVGLDRVVWILRTGDVEVHRAREPFRAAGREFPAGSYVVPMRQPYASFAQTLLERQDYPTRFEYPGGPPVRPYDATAHTLPLLMEVEAVAVDEPLEADLSEEPVEVPEEVEYPTPEGLGEGKAPRIALYKSWQEPMEAGWTRWVLDRHGVPYDTLHDAEIRGGALADYDVLLLEDQSPESIVNGWSTDRMPEPYAGGLGEEGTDEIRRFVREGGRLVAIEQAAGFAAQALGLGIGNPVADLDARDFYVPGSLLRLRSAPGDPLTQGAKSETAAWYWRSSRAFSVREPGARVLARYGEGNPLLSGWALGGERLSGRPALVAAPVGEGEAVLFGFPPNYRGQTMATWPLLFSALRGG